MKLKTLNFFYFKFCAFLTMCLCFCHGYGKLRGQVDWKDGENEWGGQRLKSKEYVAEWKLLQTLMSVKCLASGPYPHLTTHEEQTWPWLLASPPQSRYKQKSLVFLSAWLSLVFQKFIPKFRQGFVRITKQGILNYDALNKILLVKAIDHTEFGTPVLQSQSG